MDNYFWLICLWEISGFFLSYKNLIENVNLAFRSRIKSFKLKLGIFKGRVENGIGRAVD